MFDTDTNKCTLYQITDESSVNRSCHSERCDIGRANGIFEEKPMNELYSPGPCGGGIVR